MASGYTPGYIPGSTMGARVDFHYSTTYNPSTNKSTVQLSPRLRVDVYSGGISVYDGDVYGNGVSIYDMSGGYAGDYVLRAPNGPEEYQWLTPRSGSIRSFEIQHNSSGVASFTCGLIGTARCDYDGYTSRISDSEYTTVTITESAPYTLLYSANGGSGTPSVQNVYAKNYYTVNPNGTSVSRTGFRFLGWSTNPSATTASYSNGDSIYITGNTTLYAVWQKLSYTLTISGDAHSIISVTRGGTPLSNGATIYYGDVLSISISASTGYQVESRSPAANTVTVNGNVTVSATTSPMATIHKRIGGSWALYLIYVRKSGSWLLHQANIRKNNSWSKYY